MKEYYFTIEDANTGDEILTTWNPQEAYECAELAEDAEKEIYITADVFCNGCIAGSENMDRGMLEDEFCVESYKMLKDYEVKDDETVIVNGKEYPYVMNLSEYVPDDSCLRTTIDGVNYYFC